MRHHVAGAPIRIVEWCRSVAVPLTVCEWPRKKRALPEVFGLEVGPIRPRRIPGEKQDGWQE